MPLLILPPEVIIAYLIWKGSYNINQALNFFIKIIAYLIWKGSYNFLGKRY